MEETVITNLPDEIMYEIFAKMNIKSTLNCRSVCKYWFHLINSRKSIIDRLVLCINGIYFRDVTLPRLQFMPEIIPKFTTLKLFRMKFNAPLSEYLLVLLPAVRELKFIDCRVEQKDMIALFETIFGVSNSIVEQFELDGFTLLPSDFESARIKRIKFQHCEPTSTPVVKNFHIKITNSRQMITFFEHLKDMNVDVQKLSIHLEDTGGLCSNFHYEKLNEILNLFHKHYQHLIKALTIDFKHTRLDLDLFYGRLSAMRNLQLEVLKLKKEDGPWLCGVFKVFIKNQFSLKSLEILKELDQEAVDVLRPIFPELSSLKLKFTTQDNYEYFWSNFPVNINLKKFYIIAKIKLKKIFVDFEKVPTLEKLEIEGPGSKKIPQLEFRNLNASMISLKILRIYHASVEGRYLRLIFEYLNHLKELRCWNNGCTEFIELNQKLRQHCQSINNLKCLQTLWLDRTHIELIAMLKLPNLKKIGFFNSSNLTYFQYDHYLEDVQNRYLKIRFKTLKGLAKNCPSLLEICDDEFRTTYRRSEMNGKFCRTQGYQSDSDTGSSASDVEYFGLEDVDPFFGQFG